MKYFSLFVFSSALAYGQSFVTGQAARLVVGQPTFTAQQTGTPSNVQLGAVGGVAYANNTLFVVDSNRVQATPINNRVLIYTNLSSFALPPTTPIPQGIRCPVCAGTPQTEPASVVLGQPDFVTVNIPQPPTASSFRTPTGVASNGTIVAVTDTDNNRVLIWKSIPTTNGQPADIVLGQPDFVTVQSPGVVDNKSFRGPQGVWIQGNQFFVADTQNHRVLVWNSIPTTNHQPADFVLGQPNFTTATQQDQTTAETETNAANLLNPVSVTSDGTRLYVTDLGHNRVLIWNSMPTQTAQPADLELGQPNMTQGYADNSSAMCASNGTDSTGALTYPALCASTLSFPRFALSDGTHLYVADGGNDRIMVYNTIPTANGAAADLFIGEPDQFTDQITDSTDTFRPDANILRSSADTIRSPIALAWDGTNLWATDPYDMRVVAYTPSTNVLQPNSVLNAASQSVFAIGTVDLSGTITAKNTVTITIQGTNYEYTVQSSDTLATVAAALVKVINNPPGDPNVFAILNVSSTTNEVVLSAKSANTAGNSITLTATVSSGATIVATASGSTLSGGNTAAEVAPGTLVSIVGSDLSDNTATGQPDANGYYPNTLGGVQVYMDGISVPLLYVSPTQINTQIPFEVQDSSGLSSYVITKHNDGFTTYTNSVNIPIVLQNPGLFAGSGKEPRPVVAIHASSHASAVIDVGGTIKSGDVGTVIVNGVSYAYTVLSSDTLGSVRDALIALINADNNAPVRAVAAGEYDRIILNAIVAGPDGNGITVSVTNSTSASLALTALQATTCCASVAGAMVTEENPAMAGEVITVYATGLGLVEPDAAAVAAQTGILYEGPAQNVVAQPVDNAQVGGSTANVLNAELVQGMIGVYQVQLQLSSSLTSNPKTQIFIAQNVFTSNICTIPVVAAPPAQ
jgi:uncharacterized protein (TIGR03437 family)